MNPSSRRLAGLTAAALMALGAGCSVSVQNSSPAISAPAPHSGSSTASTSQPSNAGAGLEDAVLSATRPAVRTSATVLGDSTNTNYVDALSLWAGCEGEPDVVVFDVKGRKSLQGKLALRSSAPRGVVIEVLIMTDGEMVQNVRLDAGNPTPAFVPITLALVNRTTVTTQTKVVQGTCSDAADSYAVLVDGNVS